MAAKNRRKRQGCDEAEFLGCKKEDPWALIRKLEAQLAQEKFFRDKTKNDHQYEVKTLQTKVRNLEKQRKIFLEKLEQNPVEQQNKLEKELNDTSRQLREITQKLVTSQQRVDKLLRTNRGLKKSKEKMSEELLETIKRKNALIHKLKARIRDLKISQEDHVPIHKGSDSEQTNACWESCDKLNDTAEIWDHSDSEFPQFEDEKQKKDDQHNMPSDTKAMEMWDVSDEDDTHAVKEKGRTEDRCNLGVSKTLEEKNKVGECKVSFFPSMYDSNGIQGYIASSSRWNGFQKQPANTPTNCPTYLNEQLSPRKQTINENSITKDDNQNQTTHDVTSNEMIVQTKNGKEIKPGLPSSKLKCWAKAQKDHFARHSGDRNTESSCDCITRVRQFYSRIALGYKADSPTSPLQGISPPPGFNTTDSEATMHTGIDFFKTDSSQPSPGKSGQRRS